MLMSMRYRLVRSLIRVLLRCGVDEQDLETAVLRHQLKVLRGGGTRPRFTDADRAFLAAAAGFLSRDRWRSFLVGPDTLLRWHRDLAAAARAAVPSARSSSARSLDQELDPSPGAGEPQVGLPQDPRRAPEARRRRLGPDHRHGASPKRPRPGPPPDRTDLDAVPHVAGVRPAVPRRAVRGERGPRGARGDPAPAAQRRPPHRRRTYPCRAVVPNGHLISTVGALPRCVRDAGSVARRNSDSRRARDRRLNLSASVRGGNLRSVFRSPVPSCRPAGSRIR